MKMKGLDMKGTASQKSGHKSLLQVNQDRVDECKDRLVMKENGYINVCDLSWNN